MMLLMTVFAAVICTVLWYKNEPKSKMKLEILCWMYWGVSIMWFVDAIFEYAELGAEYFAPAPADILNDLYLGVSVVAFGMVIWLITLLLNDPRGVVKSTLLSIPKKPAQRLHDIRKIPDRVV